MIKIIFESPALATSHLELYSAMFIFLDWILIKDPIYSTKFCYLLYRIVELRDENQNFQLRKMVKFLEIVGGTEHAGPWKAGSLPFKGSCGDAEL